MSRNLSKIRNQLFIEKSICTAELLIHFSLFLFSPFCIVTPQPAHQGGSVILWIVLRTPFSLSGLWPAPAEKQWSTKETFTLLSAYFPLVCLTVSRVHKYFTNNFELLFGLSKNRATMYLPERNDAMIKLKLSSICYVHLLGARTYVSLSCELHALSSKSSAQMRLNFNFSV